jgi:hypothetical protein
MEWCPPVAQLAAQDRLVILGCRVRQTVTAVAWAATARVLLVATVSWAGTVEAVLPPLVCSCGGDDAVDEQEPAVGEPSVEELCMEEPFHSR